MIQKNEDELKIDALTKREMEVLKEMAVGKFNRVIAKEPITQDNSPLFLVDGFPVDDLSGIPPTGIL